MTSLAPLPEVARLSRLVVRVLGLNPGPFTLQGSNTYLCGEGSSRILVDAGEGASGYLPLLQRSLAAHGAERVSDVVITHFHHDHTEGLRDLRQAFGKELRVWKVDPGYTGEHGPSWGSDYAGEGIEVRPLADGDVVTSEDGSASIECIVTPGHTPDHCCFLLHQERAIFTGDTVLGGSSAVFEDLHAYMDSLTRLHQLARRSPWGGGGATGGAAGGSALPKARRRSRSPAKRVERGPRDSGDAAEAELTAIYPGHGPVLPDAVKAVGEYIENRNAREAGVVRALGSLWGRALGLTPLGLTG
jgi:glyoxylase-like metal-dependent hydrolase (beta-lactamase superfamily II)